MTDAPETIWATADFHRWAIDSGKLFQDHGEKGGTEYTRTDISQALIEEKDERIEELEQDCEIISSEFESDLWVVCRRLLTKTHFDFSHAHVDGIHTDEFEGHINETLAELDRSEARIAELEGDKADLMRVVTDLLGRVDDLMTPVDGYLSMHTCGQSPDWFVEAAVLGAYGTLKAKP